MNMLRPEERTIEQVNLNYEPKRSNNFEVQWLDINDNSGNILGRQTIRAVRPEVRFMPVSAANKGIRYTDIGRIEWQDVEFELEDDEGGLIQRAIYGQLSCQVGKKEGPQEFTILVKIFDSNGYVIEYYRMKRCMIMGVGYGENQTTTTEKSTMRVTINYKEVEFSED